MHRKVLISEPKVKTANQVSMNLPRSTVQGNVPILTGARNYSTWSSYMEAYLGCEGLINCVKNPLPESPTEVAIEKDLKARGRILLCVNELVMNHVKDMDTAKKVWDKLKSLYEKKGVVKVFTLLKDLMSNKLENYENEEEYLNEMMTTVGNLKNFGLELPEKIIGIFLLLGLPEEFTPMIMGIQNLESMTSESIQERIIEQCSLLSHGVNENRKHFQESTEMRWLFSNAGKHMRYSAVRGGKKSYYQKNNDDYQSSTSFVPRCYDCNRKGHKANECPNPKRKRKTSSKHRAYVAEDESEIDMDSDSQDEVLSVHYHALIDVEQKIDDDIYTWVIDSGASRHMCKVKELFVNLNKSTISILLLFINSGLNLYSML